MRPADTTPEAWQMWLTLVRRMTPEERLERALAFSDEVRRLREEVLRQQNPDATDRQIFLLAARERLGAELFDKVYGSEALYDRPPGLSSRAALGRRRLRH